jgi:hypothetical protein
MDPSEIRHLLFDLDIEYEDNRTNMKLINKKLKEDNYKGPLTIYDIRLFYNIGLNRKDFETLNDNEIDEILKALGYTKGPGGREVFIESIVNRLNEYGYKNEVTVKNIVKYSKVHNQIKLKPKYKKQNEKPKPKPKSEYRMCINYNLENDTDFVKINIHKSVNSLKKYISSNTLLFYEDTKERVETLRKYIIDDFQKKCDREFVPHTQGCVMKIKKNDLEFFKTITNEFKDLYENELEALHEFLDGPKPWSQHKDFFTYQKKQYKS